MTTEVLLASHIPPEHAAAIEQHFVLHRLADAADREQFLAEVGPRIKAMVTSGFRGYNRALLDALPNIEIVTVWGDGLQALDLDAARERGIAVTNTPDNSKIAVAELAMGLLLAAARWLPDGDRYARSGRWSNEAYGRMGVGLAGKRCGIVAMGTIGRAVAKRAASFDMRVSYFGPRKKDDVPYDYVGDLTTLARDSDFLVLCCPETAETRGSITAEVLAALGPDGILVNVARGPVVDEAALHSALESGAIRAAALDVFHDEPNVSECLRLSERVVLSAHIGTQTEDVRRLRKELVLANLQAHFSGAPLVTPVLKAGR